MMVILICSSCASDEATPELKEYQNVDERLWSYFQDFEEAGEKRGFEVNYQENRIVALIEEIETNHIGGQCLQPPSGSKRIIIDEDFFINTEDELIKELVIFHEIGHCLLGRDHRDDSFQNGICKSIMRTGTGECLDNYKANTRERYLDEMFDPDAF